jgi:hypothetical protein
MHLEWEDKQPFKAALEGDMKALNQSGASGLVELIMITQAGCGANFHQLRRTGSAPRAIRVSNNPVPTWSVLRCNIAICVKTGSLIKSNTGASIQSQFRVAAITLPTLHCLLRITHSAFATRNKVLLTLVTAELVVPPI